MLKDLFDAAFYLETNQDVADAGFNTDPNSDMFALNHYLDFGAAEERDPNPLFVTSFYFNQRLDVLDAGVEPFGHYLEIGFEEDTLDGAGPQSDPNRPFDTAEYLAENQDVASAGINPLAHYIGFGEDEILAGDRAALDAFDPIFYRDTYDDVRAAVEAGVFQTYLEHWVRFGQFEIENGRLPVDPDPPEVGLELGDITATSMVTVLALNSNELTNSIIVVNDVNGNGEADILGREDEVDVLNLRGDASVRIDLTDSQEQLEQIDIDGDGEFDEGTDEFNARDKVNLRDFEIIDAHPRIVFDEDGNVVANALLDPTDTENGFTGDILLDGTGSAADGVNTDGNIFLGGWGDDTAFGGDGNDFFSGGGGENLLSGNRNADFFYVELSTLDEFFTGAQTIKAGNTGDEGGVDGPQDKDWLLLEASDDQEVIRIDLNLADGINTDGTLPDDGGVATENGVIDFGAGDVGVGAFLEDVENVNASGTFFGFLDTIDVDVDAAGIEISAFDPAIGVLQPAWDRAVQFSITLTDDTEIRLTAEEVSSITGVAAEDLDFEEWLQAAVEVFDVSSGGDFIVEGDQIVDETFNIVSPSISFTDTNAAERDFITSGGDRPNVGIEQENGGVASTSAFELDFVVDRMDFEDLFFGDFRDFTPDPEDGIIRVPGLSPGSTGQLDIAGTNDMNIIVGGYDNDIIDGGGGMDLLFGGDLQFLLTFRNNANLFDSTGALIANTRDAGPGSLAVGDQVADDGRDTLLGGVGDDNLVFELDRGTYLGDGGASTLPAIAFAETPSGNGVSNSLIVNSAGEGTFSITVSLAGATPITISAAAGTTAAATAANLANALNNAGLNASIAVANNRVVTFGDAEVSDFDLAAAGLDTLWLTEFTAGRVGGDSATRTPDFGTFDSVDDGTSPFDEGNTGDEDPAIEMLTTDSTIRIDLGVGYGSEYQGYGGADDLVDGVSTADQTNYRTADERTVVRDMEHVNASGLGGIDYLAAGTNDPDLIFDNQQNFNGTGIDLDLRGLDTEDAARAALDDNDALDTAPDINDRNFSELQMLHFVAGVNQVVSREGPVQPVIEGGFDSEQLGALSPADFNRATVFTDFETLRGDEDSSRFSLSDNGGFRLDSDQGVFQSDDSLNTDRIEVEQNSLIAGSGNDTIEGRGGDDRLSGREGDDTFFISLNDGDNFIGSGSELSIFGDNVNFISRDLDVYTYTTLEDAPFVESVSPTAPDGIVDRVDTQGRLSNDPTDRVLIGQDFRPVAGIVEEEINEFNLFVLSTTLQFRTDVPGTVVNEGDLGPFEALNTVTLNFSDELDPAIFGEEVGGQTSLTVELGDEVISAEDLLNALDEALPEGYVLGLGSTINGGMNDSGFDLDPEDAVEITSDTEAVPEIESVDLDDFNQPEGSFGGYDVVEGSNIIIDPGSTEIEDDKLVFVSYNNRLDNEKAADEQTLNDNGDPVAESLGKEAYAEDVVVRFDGTSTTIAEGQEYQIYLDDLAKGDVVTVKVNGQQYTLRVGFDRDDNDIGGETTEAFADRLAGVVNATRADDPHTAAGAVFARVVDDVPANAGDENDAILVLRQTPVFVEQGGSTGLENVTAARAEQVFMDLPVVIVEEAQTTGDQAIAIVKDTSDTSAVLFGYDGRAEADGINKGFGPLDDRADGRFVTFEGETEQNRSVLQTADPAGGVLSGQDAYENGTLVRDTLQFVNFADKTGNVGGTSVDPTSGIGEPGTASVELDGWAAVHGDDLLLGSDPTGVAGTGNDSITALTGDDRIVGSKGDDTVDGGGDILFDPVTGAVIEPPTPLSSEEADARTPNTFANASDVVRFVDTLVFEERDFLNEAAANNPAFSIVVTGNGAGQVLVDENATAFFEEADHTTSFTNMEIVRTLSGNDMGVQLADDELNLGRLTDGVAFILEDDPVFHDDNGNLLPGFVDAAGNPLVVEVSDAAWRAENLPVNGPYSGAISVRQVPDIELLVEQAAIDQAFVGAAEDLIVEGIERIVTPAPAVGALNVDDQTRDEDAGVIVFEVTRDDLTVDDVRYEVLFAENRPAATVPDFQGATGDGSATNPFFEGVVNFIEDGTTGLVQIPIFDDEVDEFIREDFIFRVFSESNALFEDDSQGTIVDNDATVLDTAALIDEFPLAPTSEGQSVTFTISLADTAASAPLDPTADMLATQDVTVTFRIFGISGNPTDAEDFDLTAINDLTVEGTATIPAGANEVEVTVPAVLDGGDEPTEEFQVSLISTDDPTVGIFGGFEFTTGSLLNVEVEDVLAVNDTAAVDENATVDIDVLANDSDPQNDPLTVIEIEGQAATAGTPITLASGADATLNADGTIEYDPTTAAFQDLDPGATFDDSFTYTISDGANTDTATVDVTVTGIDEGAITIVDLSDETAVTAQAEPEIFVFEFNSATGLSLSSDAIVTIDGFDPATDLLRFDDAADPPLSEADFLGGAATGGAIITIDAFGDDTGTLVSFGDDPAIAEPGAGSVRLLDIFDVTLGGETPFFEVA